MKGQLFISDVLVSVLIITLLIGFTVWEMEQAYDSSGDIEYAKINTVANDVAQMAVKNMLANRSGDAILPNWIDQSRWIYLQRNMSDMIRPPYAYNATIAAASLTASGNGGCSQRPNVVNIRRIVYVNGAAAEFRVLVCI